MFVRETGEDLSKVRRVGNKTLNLVLFLLSTSLCIRLTYFLLLTMQSFVVTANKRQLYKTDLEYHQELIFNGYIVLVGILLFLFAPVVFKKFSGKVKNINLLKFLIFTISIELFVVGWLILFEMIKGKEFSYSGYSFYSGEILYSGNLMFLMFSLAGCVGVAGLYCLLNKIKESSWSKNKQKKARLWVKFNVYSLLAVCFFFVSFNVTDVIYCLRIAPLKYYVSILPEAPLIFPIPLIYRELEFKTACAKNFYDNGYRRYNSYRKNPKYYSFTNLDDPK